MVSFIKPTDADVTYIAEHMRSADAVEVYESGRRSPIEALRMSVRLSERSAVIRVDDEPVAAFGVSRVTTLSLTGVPWLLGTDMVKRHARRLMRHAPGMVDRMMEGHNVLRNYVHEDNHVAIRWLESMGFTMEEPKPTGWRGAMFHPFEMRRK